MVKGYIMVRQAELRVLDGKTEKVVCAATPSCTDR
jgi:hypothetical protein